MPDITLAHRHTFGFHVCELNFCFLYLCLEKANSIEETLELMAFGDCGRAVAGREDGARAPANWPLTTLFVCP